LRRQILEQVEAAAVGQVQIDQHDVRDEARQRRARFGERRRGVDGKAVGGEDRRQAGQAIGIVFDNQCVWHGERYLRLMETLATAPWIRRRVGVRGLGAVPCGIQRPARLVPVFIEKAVHFTHSFFTSLAVALLNQPGELVGAAFGLRQLVVCQFAPRGFRLADDLLPLAFSDVIVHGTSP
jgi:hypothetical protein